LGFVSLGVGFVAIAYRRWRPQKYGRTSARTVLLRALPTDTIDVNGRPVGPDIEIEDYIPPEMLIAHDRLTFEHVLGGGSAGLVKAGKIGDSIHVAIKQVSRTHISTDGAGWWRECEILARQRHPNCVAFYGFSYDEKYFMMIQELCYGGHLRDAFSKSAEVVLQRAGDFMLQIAAGVEYLHRLKIIHRDIKPENVLLSSADHKTATLKLADFGQSKMLSAAESADTESGMTGGMGTVRYMAPELLVPEYKMGVDGYKCDVYSVAIMFAEITIPHCDAYEGMWNFRIVEAVMKEGLRPPLPDNLPGGTSELIREMWDEDPKKRPNIAEVLSGLSTSQGPFLPRATSIAYVEGSPEVV